MDDDNHKEDFITALTHLKNLGTGDASTSMGAIQLLSHSVKVGSQNIANGLHAIADAIKSQKEP